MSEDVKIRQIALARVLLDDIAMSRLAPQPLLIKTRRLARLLHAQEIMKWLGWEVTGYSAETELEVTYLEKTGRFIDKRTWTFYSQPLAELDQKISTVEAELRYLKSSNGHPTAPPQRSGATIIRFPGTIGAGSISAVSPSVIGELALTQEIGRLKAIRSRVLSMLHEFVGSTYCTLVFRRLVETIFERHQTWADALLHDGVGDALEEIPVIYQRLSSANREALVHALERVWNCQPLAWRPNGRQVEDLPSAAEAVQEMPGPQPSTEEVLAQFNRVVRELLGGKMNRAAPRRSREDQLRDIRRSPKESLVRRPHKTVARPVEKGARLA